MYVFEYFGGIYINVRGIWWIIINEYKVFEIVLWYYEFVDFINEKDMVNYFYFLYKYEYVDVRV